MTTSSSKLQATPPGNKAMAKVPNRHSRSKVREAKAGKEAKVAKASSNQTRSNVTYSWTTMTSWATPLVCTSPCSTMTAATAREELATATHKTVVIWTTIIATLDMGHNIDTPATKGILRTPTRDPPPTMVH